MKRQPRPDELKLWARVAATVHPAPGRHAPPPVAAEPFAQAMAAQAPLAPSRSSEAVKSPRARPLARRSSPPETIEPGRKRRLTRERDPLGPRLDLHGLDQDQARAALTGFLRRAQDDGWRAVLVITGKGSRGDGVLRRMTPEWLASPGLRDLISGVSEAHPRHGGRGAVYVALKRRPRA